MVCLSVCPVQDDMHSPRRPRTDQSLTLVPFRATSSPWSRPANIGHAWKESKFLIKSHISNRLTGENNTCTLVIIFSRLKNNFKDQWGTRKSQEQWALLYMVKGFIVFKLNWRDCGRKAILIIISTWCHLSVNSMCYMAEILLIRRKTLSNQSIIQYMFRGFLLFNLHHHHHHHHHIVLSNTLVSLDM